MVKSGCLLLLAVTCVIAQVNENKRVVDNPPFKGGGRIDRAKFKDYPPAPVPDPELQDAGNSLLLQVDPPPAESEPFSFLLNEQFAQCYQNDERGQGLSCNSCWAFATAKMINARRCRHLVAKNEWKESERLSALEMICALQSAVNDSICASRSMWPPLEHAATKGLIRESWLHEWKDSEAKSMTYNMESEDLKTRGIHRALLSTSDEPENSITLTPDGFLEYAGVHIDVSNPKVAFCNHIFNTTKKEHEGAMVKVGFRAPTEKFGAQGPTMLRKYLRNGPVVAALRLTWEFFTFKGSLFPSGPQTFCRPAESDNEPADYCSSERKRLGTWDDKQRDHQNDPDDSNWYNHFITIHGWGVKGGVNYWVVENSWGRIYENDASTGNNGAGSKYKADNGYSENPTLEKLPYMDKNHFVLIDNAIAGEKGLAFTNREFYLVRF